MNKFISLLALSLISCFNISITMEEKEKPVELTIEEKERLHDLPIELQQQIKRFALDPNSIGSELVQATKRKEIEKVKKLLNQMEIYPYNIQVKILNTQDKNLDETSLFFAARAGLNEVVKLILNRIKNFDEQDQVNILNSLNFERSNALLVALQNVS